MNKKTGLVIRMILGGYLVVLGLSLSSQLMRVRPSDFMIKGALALLFIVVGGIYLVTNMKAVYKQVKDETEETDGAEDDFATPVHREAPRRVDLQNVELTGKKEQSVSSQDVQSNEKEQKATSVEAQKELEEVKEEATSVKTETDDKTKVIDPVNLAIEIMEDEERTSQDEDLEKDYEEM